MLQLGYIKTKIEQIDYNLKEKNQVETSQGDSANQTNSVVRINLNLKQ